MKYSGIGGQAVMEGIMMKNKDSYAVAVRKPDQDIIVEVFEYKGIFENSKITKLPFFRGVFNFIDSLVLGIKSLSFSASFFEEEEEKSTIDSKKEKYMMGATIAFSVVVAVVIFMLTPYFLSQFFVKLTTSYTILAFIEGIIRLSIFIAYVALISLMPDILRVYMYHGAEHKCINCIEHGLELNIENVKNSSRFHKRCGTSFLILVMIISIFVFAFIRVDSHVLRVVFRVVLIPVIAGISYEFIRLAGRQDNVLVNLLSMPGLWLQKITTKEPDEKMIEVGIKSVEAVFDWKKFVDEVNQ